MVSTSLPPAISEAIDLLSCGERDRHAHCMQVLVTSVEPAAGWADAAWKRIRPLTRHADNRVRSIAGQALCALAPETSKTLISRDLDAILGVTRDERLVTARHVLLAIWQLGTTDAKLRTLLAERLCERFKTCESEKNATLIRYDIQCVLRKLVDITDDAKVREMALSLIQLEADSKYRKKYSGVWRAT